MSLHFTSQEIEKFKAYRQSKLPGNFTIEDEQQILNHYCNVLIQDFLRDVSPQETQFTILYYCAVLLKRFYMRFDIFEKQEVHQFALICTYLGMKLDEVQHEHISQFAETLKKKPKHSRYVHFGDDSYAKLEMVLVHSLDYQIQIKPLFPIILSINNMLKLSEYLKPFLYTAYMKQATVFFHRALQGFTIFLHKEGIIALCIVELALSSILQELQLTSGSSIVGASNRPVEQQEKKKLRDLHDSHLSSGKLVIELRANLSNQEEIQEKVNGNRMEIKSLLKHLQNQSDTPIEMDWSKYRNLKSQQFPHPRELFEVPKQIKHK